jgi:tetratricopeptide (TPR) repeat protein
VIPTPEQLDAISRMMSGTLQDVPVAPLLLAQAVHRTTCALEIRRRQVWKRIVFEGGVPVDCRSNLVHETLGRYMVIEGRLSDEDFTSSLGRAAARGVPLGEELLERGLVTPENLFRILQANLAKKLLDLFTWREGEFHAIEDDSHAADSSLKLRVPQLILTGVTKLAPQEEIDMSVGPLVGQKLCLHPAPPVPLEEMRFSAKQSALVEALRPGRRMGELAEATGLAVDEITRLLYALLILGVCVPESQMPRGAVPNVTRPIPMPVPAPAQAVQAVQAVVAVTAPAAAPVMADPDPGDTERRRNAVMQAFLVYRRQDAFDLLGIPEEATLPVVHQKFLEFARRFAPWTFHGPELAGVEEKAQDLFLAGAQAYGELTDAERRNTLIFRRKTLRDERARKAPSMHQIKTDLLDSEAQFKKGQAAMEAGKYRDAIMLLEFAADCDPQNGLYASELARCRFLNSSAAAPQAIRELQEALRRDPNCGIAAFYAGEIERQMGNYDEAEAHLRRAIKLMSPDRRPIDALKQLSTDRTRRR